MLLWPSVGPMEELMERDLWRHNSSSDRYNPLQPPALVKLLWQEVHKKNGCECLPDSIYHLCSKQLPIYWHLQEFRLQWISCHSRWRDEAKRLQALGVGTKKMQAESLTEEKEEKLLWQKRLLGDHSPQALLNTMVFMNSLYFALCSGNEYQDLHFLPCHIGSWPQMRTALPTVHRRPLKKPPRWPKRETNQTKSGS